MSNVVVSNFFTSRSTRVSHQTAKPLKKYRVPYRQHEKGEIVIDITVRVLPKGTQKVPNSGSSSSEDGVNQEIDRRVESNQGVREMLDCH